MHEPVVFTPSVESLFVHGLRLSFPAREQLRALGLDLDRPLLPAYPLATWERAVAVAAGDAFPQLGRDAAHFELGRRMLAGYDATVIGRAISLAARLAGPRRTLERMAQNTGTANNYVLALVEPLPDGGLRMTNTVQPALEPVLRARGHALSPTWLPGLVTGLLENLRVARFEVTPEPGAEPLRVSCRVRL
jgi:uncharacterized protein (TIGR02265 family)